MSASRLTRIRRPGHSAPAGLAVPSRAGRPASIEADTRTTVIASAVRPGDGRRPVQRRRRRLLPALLATGLLPLLAAGPLQAQQSPGTTPIPELMRIVVPFSAGGSNDQIARAIAPLLARQLGTSVIVENRPGAGSVVGSDFVAKSAPNGSVLLLNSSSFLTAAATQPKTPFDPLTSFAPVAMVGEGPMLLATSADKPYRSAAELIAAAKAKAEAVSYGSSGIGSIAHLSSELISHASGATMLHVPYKGAANALLDLVGGQIDLMVSNYSSLAPQIKAGKVRPLAVTSRQRSPAFADLPALSESLPDFGVDIWVGVFAPAGTPAVLVERLNREINAIATTPEVRALLDPDGSLPSSLTPAQVAERVRVDYGLWKQIATEKGIVAQ